MTNLPEITKNINTSVVTLSAVSNSVMLSRENNPVTMTFIIKTMDNMLKKFENIKEDLLVSGIKNLRKKVNFIQLNNEFQNGDIDEDEYNHELEAFPDKYIIDIKMLDSKFELIILNDVIQKIGTDLSVDEVSEIFSIDMSRLKAAN